MNNSSSFDQLDDIIGSGGNGIILGESGIGKSYFIDKWLEKHSDDFFTLHINNSPFNTCSYGALNNSLTLEIINLQCEGKYKKLIELSYIIPCMERSLIQIMKNMKYKELDFEKIIHEQKNIKFDRANTIFLIEYIESLAVGKRICICCDNIQWYDKESLETLFSMALCPKSQKWIILFSYTTNSRFTDENHNIYIQDAFNEIELSPINRCIFIELLKWQKEELPILCQEILHTKIAFSKKQYHTLFKYTQGQPFYLKTILEVFVKENIIEISSKETKVKKWNEDHLKNILNNFVLKKIKKSYKIIPDSKKLLETASVIGEIFSDDTIEKICDEINAFKILIKVQQESKIINHVLEYNEWKFEHFLIQGAIYDSLGKKARSIHLKIADFLASEVDQNLYGKIAMHYEMAGETSKSIEYEIKEVSYLLEKGCYNSASEKITAFEQKTHIPALPEKLLFLFYKMKIKTLFFNRKYNESISLSNKILGWENIPTEMQSECLLWIGKSYLKLDTRPDYIKGRCFLRKAKILYEKKFNYTELGKIYGTIAVAYAHLNRHKRAKFYFEQAQRRLSENGDQIALLKQQKQCVIFMRPKNAALFLEKTAESFGKLDMPQEQIMALNNAATQYIFMREKRAKSLLEKALKISRSCGKFGIAYIHNNIAIINIENKEKSYRSFEEARKFASRASEKLIIEINAVTLELRNGTLPNNCIDKLEKLKNDAEKIGEDEYILPVTINLARAYIMNSNFDQAFNLIAGIEKQMRQCQSFYRFTLWMELIKECSDKSIVGAEELYNEYHKILSNENKNNFNLQPIKYDDYALLTLQFWSDN